MPGIALLFSFDRDRFVDTSLAAGNEDTPSSNTFCGFFEVWPTWPCTRRVLRDGAPKRLDGILLNDPGRRIDERSNVVVRHRDE